jgi:hypothetical protein
MRGIEKPGDWEPICPFLPKKEAEAALRRWVTLHGELAENDLRTDIGRAADGKTVFRFQRRRSASSDINPR